MAPVAISAAPTAAPPRWMVDRHPDMLALDAEGRPDTATVNESLERTTLFVQRGNTLFRVARRGDDSPFGVPWGSLFDPQVSERGGTGARP